MPPDAQQSTPFWLRFFLGYSALVAVIVLLLGFGKATGITIVLATLGAVPTIVRQSPILFASWQRARFFVANTAMTWDLAFRFEGDASIDAVDRFINDLPRESGESAGLIGSTDVTRLVRYKGIFTVEFILSRAVSELNGLPTGRIAGIDVHVFEQRVGFRQSESMLHEYLLPLMEQIGRALKPDRTLFTLRLHFDGVNPFLGLYLQQLDARRITEFHLRFSLQASDVDDYVDVTRDTVEICSRSEQSFRRSALQALTFAVPAKK